METIDELDDRIIKKFGICAYQSLLGFSVNHKRIECQTCKDVARDV